MKQPSLNRRRPTAKIDHGYLTELLATVVANLDPDLDLDRVSEITIHVGPEMAEVVIETTTVKHGVLASGSRTWSFHQADAYSYAGYRPNLRAA